MGPHADHFHGADFFQDLIDQPMLDVDAAGIGTRQIAHKFFIWRRILEGIFLKDRQQRFGFGFESGRGKFFSVFLSGFGEDELPFHHLRVLEHFRTDVLRPLRMDSLIPGTERR